MKKLFALLVLCVSTIIVSGASLSGVVFEDSNGNGLQDRNERGIANIPVSNGDLVIMSSKGGEFTIEVEQGQSIFPILPSNYKMTANKVANANFFNYSSAVKTDKVTFPLVKQEVKKSFRVAAVGDTQVTDEVQLSYANRSILSELASRNDLDFSIFAGDISFDRNYMLPVLKDALNALPSASWAVAGNHDRDKVEGETRDYSMFNSLYGASDYAFNYGNVCFIILCNAQTNDKTAYTGYLSDRQMRFIKNVLDITPKDRLVVFSQHVPMKAMKNLDEIVKLLSDRPKVLALSGHTHTVSKHVLAENICEQIVGTSCGMWWSGERSFDAVPSSLQFCGTPRNYFIVDFDNNDYSLTFKGVGLDASRQADVWVKSEEVIDDDNEGFAAIEANTIIVNVFGGGDSAIVKMKVDNGEWQTLDHTSMIAPSSIRIIDWNKNAGYPTKFSRKANMRTQNSPHIWSGKLPATLASGTHTIDIVATDNYGLNMKMTKILHKK